MNPPLRFLVLLSCKIMEIHSYPSYLFLQSDSAYKTKQWYLSWWVRLYYWYWFFYRNFDQNLWQVAILEFITENMNIRVWFKLKTGRVRIQLQLRFYQDGWEGVLYLKVKQVSSWSLRSRFRMKRDFGRWVPPKVFIEVQQYGTKTSVQPFPEGWKLHSSRIKTTLPRRWKLHLFEDLLRPVCCTNSIFFSRLPQKEQSPGLKYFLHYKIRPGRITANPCQQWKSTY